MVVYKSDIKRRYRDGSSNVESLPKRAKVHAQRKFAQGLNLNTLPEKTFVKEKGKVKSNGNSDPLPLLPADRPKTEDFLTFLCFRGTSALPTRLDFFNVASSSDNSGSAIPSTSNQSSNEFSSKVKNDKITGKHSAVKIHPNKFKEKARKGRIVASRMNVKKRGGRLVGSDAIIRKQKLRRPQRSSARRPLQSAVQRRIADKKMRAGLRSGGTLPAGYDAGLSTFRRPRSDRSSSCQTVTYPVRKSAIPLGDTSADDEDEEYDEDVEGEEEDDGEKSVTNMKETKDDKSARVRTRSSSLKSNSSPAHSLKRMPSRKTKEAATAYMEMLSKSLRSPDIETESSAEEEVTSKNDKESKKINIRPKRQIKPVKKVLPIKNVPGRSLKDKSLKRMPQLNNQRKNLVRNLRVRRVEELVKTRTRSRGEETSVESNRRSLRDKNKTKTPMEEDRKKVTSSESEDDEEEEEDDIIFNKSGLKNQDKTKSGDNVTTRRSRRSCQDKVDDSNSKKNDGSNLTPKQSRRTAVTKEHSVERAQDTRITRRSRGLSSDSNKNSSKKAQALSSAVGLRNRDNINKKEDKNDSQEMEKGSFIGKSTDLPRKGRILKVEIVDEMLKESKTESSIKGRGNVRKEDERKNRASPSSSQNQDKSGSKKNLNDDLKNESDPPLGRTVNRKGIQTEAADNEEEKSPAVRTTRKSTLEKASEEPDLSKNKQKNQDTVDNPIKKKGPNPKIKTSVDKSAAKKSDETTITKKTDDIKTQKLTEESNERTTRLSRSSSTQIIDARKKFVGKKQETVENTVVSESNANKRNTRNKSVAVTNKTESESEDVPKEKNLKKQLNSSEDSKLKTQTKKKTSLIIDKVAVSIEESKSDKLGIPASTPKLGVRKKSNAANTGDEDSASKETPKKKLKQSTSVKEEPVEVIKENTKSDTKKKNIPKEQIEKSDKVVDTNLSKNKADENKKNLADADSLSENKSNKKPDNLEVMNKANLKNNSTDKGLDSRERESSIDKLDEKDLKGFDEINAKEMENKVDKFIEQIILKTSDDESKSKIRSKFKQTGSLSFEDNSRNKLIHDSKKGKLVEQSETGKLVEPTEKNKLIDDNLNGKLGEDNKKGKLPEDTKKGKQADENKKGKIVDVDKRGKSTENKKEKCTGLEDDKKDKVVDDNKKDKLTDENKKGKHADENKKGKHLDENKKGKPVEDNKKIKLIEDPIKSKVSKSSIVKEMEKVSSDVPSSNLSESVEVKGKIASDTSNVGNIQSGNTDSAKNKPTVNTGRGKRKNAAEHKLVETGGKSEISQPKDKMCDDDDDGANKAYPMNKPAEKRLTPELNPERSNKLKKGIKRVNISQCRTSANDKVNKGDGSEISLSRRTSVSSIFSTDTSVSENCKVLLEDLDCLDFPIVKKVKDVNDKQTASEKTLVSKKVTEFRKTSTRGRVLPKKPDVSCKNDSSDSEEESFKKESKVRMVKKKKAPSVEVKALPRRGVRELKGLDITRVTLRTSRARLAKHSISSFYYETGSSSHYSSSEEEIPPKKSQPPNKKENPPIPQLQNNDAKESSKDLKCPAGESVKASVSVVEEKKLNEIPDDLIDFKSDFDRNDSFIMDSSLKDSRHLTREVLSPEDVRNIVKDIKASIPKITDLASTSTPVDETTNNAVHEASKTISEKKVENDNMLFDEARSSMDLLASVAEDVSSKMNSMSAEQETKPPVEKQDAVKTKQPSSFHETWVQAFKRAKIPKHRQFCQVSPNVKPFERKPLVNQPFSKQPSPLKRDPSSPSNFRPFDRSSLKFQSPNSPQKETDLSHGNRSTPPIPPVNTLSRESLKEESGSVASPPAITPSALSNFEIKREQTTNSFPNQQQGAKCIPPNPMHQSFKPVDSVKEESKPSDVVVEPVRTPIPGRSVDIRKDRETPGGKHHNLPLTVEHTFRKMSPVAVSRKPTVSVSLKPQIQPLNQDIKEQIIFDKQSKSNRSSPSSGSKSSWLWKPADSLVTKPSDLDLMAKKKVNMTVEEIEKWLDDSTSSGIEHSKDCGLFEKNQCECSFRTSGSSMQNSVNLLAEERSKVGRSIVEPPIQLKDIEPKCTAETISACKVEDYKEKLISKSSSCQAKEIKLETRKDVSPKYKVPTPTKQERPWKSTRSMTEEEMCDFDFRFERNSNSPRESGSEMSSPTPKDEMSSSNDEGIGSHQSERKIIFQKKNRLVSKSPCAFNAENESSVYAFELDSDLPLPNQPFRRKNRLSGEDNNKSTSIAVQVNLEPETVLECSTQTEQEEEFYIPLRRKSVEPQQMIQGVTVKLDAEPDGQDQGVTLRAKIVTKPTDDFPRPPSALRNFVGRSSNKSGKPEQKVRPLSVSDSKLPVQPTTQHSQMDLPSTSQDSLPASTSSKSSQSTQLSTTPLKLPTDNKPTSPLPSNLKSNSDSTEPRRAQSETGFPKVGMAPKIVEAPSFYPTEKEFLDPLEYLVKITPEAEHYGICRIVPPPSFKPECKVSDDMRFTSYNHYVHKMMRRWGPNVKEMTAIKKYLATQCIALTHPPWIGGMEVDLPRLYQTVQHCGGLKEVIEKKRWTRVADAMKIPKTAQDRVTKLDDTYCKYLLPYDTLSHDERCKLLEQVEHDWQEKERRILLGESTNNSDSESDSDSDDGMIECITKGRSMALSQFYRIARNTLWMWFGSEGDPPCAKDVETEYWHQVTERSNHVCVHSGSIDCGTWGYGFPTAKTSSTSKHPWNLKVLTNHPASALRSLPPLMGVTVPTLHVGMLFATFCWYRDPHGLPWIEYLHTGANKIWYGVPNSWTNELRGAIKSVLPSIVRESPVWLPSDTAMLPPQLLLDKGVSLCRTVQEPGQFIVIFPKAYTSAICTGYLVSESVYYAPSSWLATAEALFKETKESCEPTMFSLEKLLFFIANDTRSSLDILIQVCSMVESVRNREVKERKELRNLGLESSEKLPKPSKRNSSSPQQEYECNNCRSNLFLSHVNHSSEDINYCLADALDMLTKDASQLKFCKLMYLYDEEEMEELIDKIKSRIDTKSQKKNSKSNASSGGSSKA